MEKLSVRSLALTAIFASVAVPCSLAYAQDGSPDGNRYYKPRYYAGEISAAKTYVDAVLADDEDSNDRDWYRRHPSKKLVILDVRTTSEYKAGHPEGAYHMPYPRIYSPCVGNLRTEDGECQKADGAAVIQDPADLFAMVEELFPDKDQPLATLCRTGSRSVDAANVLSSPETYLGPDYEGQGYTHVYNIWQGFVGQPMAGVVKSGGLLTIGPKQEPANLVLSDQSEVAGFAAYALDLDNDGEYGDADDKDGWRYHQGLPYSTRLLKDYINGAAAKAGYYRKP
jgi:rhodanese-related sulfurtransferase